MGENITGENEEQLIVAVPLPMKDINPFGPDELAAYLAHPVLLRHVDWTAALPVGTADSIDTYSIWKSSTSIAAKIKYFRYLTGTIKYRVKFDGYPYNYGKMVFCVEPKGEIGGVLDNVTKPAPPQGARSMILPHLDLDPATKTEQELTVPMCSPYGCWTTTGTARQTHMAYFNIINPLQTVAAGTAKSVPMCVYMWIEDAKLHVPIYQSETHQTDILSTSVTKAAQTLRSLAKFPLVSRFASPMAEVASAGGKALAAFGYNKPTVMDVSQPVLNLSVSNNASVDGRAAIQKMSNFTTQELSFTADAAGLGTNDDMVIQDIIGRWGYCNGVTFGASIARGTLILNQRVHPASCVAINTIYTEPTPLNFVQAMFSYWRGDMDYCIEVVASQFQRGSLLFCYSPDGSVPLTLSDASTMLKCWTVSISGRTKAYIRIPWSQLPPVLDCAFPTTSATATNNGSLLCFVLNGLETNGTEPVSINLYHKGNETFQFFLPTTKFIENAVFQSSDDVVVTRLTGEKFNSIKQLCMKVSGSLNVQEVAGTYTAGRFLRCYLPNFVFPKRTPALNVNFVGVTVTNGFLEWCETAYMARRGGLRWMFARQTALPSSIAATCLGTDLAYVSVYEPVGGANTGATFGNLLVTGADGELPVGAINFAAFYKANSPWAEFEVPGYNWANYIPTLLYDTKNANGFWFTSQEGRTVRVTWPFKRSGADDYSLHFFRGLPLMVL